MTRYNKLWASLIGLIVLVGLDHFNVALPGFDAIVLDLIVSALTALGVYQVPNAEDPR